MFFAIVAVGLVLTAVLLSVFLAPQRSGGDRSADSDATVGSGDEGSAADAARNSNLDVTELTQADFEQGTYRIRQSGRYVLQENIVFNPNPPTDDQDAYDSFFPTAAQLDGVDSYPVPLYTLGWFAGITVETDNVEIDLNGFTFEQGVGHALMQRFFTLISLANSVFITGQGPHAFTDEGEFVAATNVVIRNGRLGRSSHHGVHGNLNEDVVIEDIVFNGFEVAAVHLNGVDGFTMQRCTVDNRKDVPVLGTFSSARFLQRYIDYLVDHNSSTTITIRGREMNATAIRENLRTSINNVYADVVELGEIDEVHHPMERSIYGNEGQKVDGNSYGVVLNHVGVAVAGFPTIPTDPQQRPSRNVTLRDITVNDQQANILEVVALRVNDQPLTDPVGSVMQILKTDVNGNYVTINATTSGGGIDATQASYLGNPIVDAQMFVGKAILNDDFLNSEHSTMRSRVTQAVIDWIEAGESGQLSDVAPVETGFLCNGDDMSHVQKGMIGFRIDASESVSMTDCHVNGMSSTSLDGSTLCGNYTMSHRSATLTGYNGAHVRAFSFAGSENTQVSNCSASRIHAEQGDAFGFSMITNSRRITLDSVEVQHVSSGMFNATGIFGGSDTSDITVRDFTVENVTAPAAGEAQGTDNVYSKQGNPWPALPL